ncbi:MAG TPA: hypothetical protein VF039_03120 [Longimicrobiales bacterium]
MTTDRAAAGVRRLLVTLLLLAAAVTPARAQWTTDRFTDGPPPDETEPYVAPARGIDARDIEHGLVLGGLGGLLLARGVCAMQLRDTTECGSSMMGAGLVGVVVGGLVWPYIAESLERWIARDWPEDEP